MSFFDAVVDSLGEQIAVIDEAGCVVWVNRSWKAFYRENGGAQRDTWAGANYLNACAAGDDEDGVKAMTGITSVLRGDERGFRFEYPCHSPSTDRWFMMRLCPLDWSGPRRFVVTHQDITERKLAELEVAALATIDGLTGIANRRRFDAFLDDEWRRAARSGRPVSLALFDIDHFKPFNDNYGHQAGDACLQLVGGVLKTISRRSSDLAARYGGEEFAIVVGDTGISEAGALGERVRRAVQDLNVPHEHSTESGCVTVSVGVASRVPCANGESDPAELIRAADRALYEAKHGGRNRVCIERGGAVRT